jgi:hypothetical protein
MGININAYFSFNLIIEKSITQSAVLIRRLLRSASCHDHIPAGCFHSELQIFHLQNGAIITPTSSVVPIITTLFA